MEFPAGWRCEARKDSAGDAFRLAENPVETGVYADLRHSLFRLCYVAPSAESFRHVGTKPSGAEPICRASATRSPARWNRQQRLFDALVALPEAERAGWLAVQPDDDSLKREALALAETDAQSGDAIAH